LEGKSGRRQRSFVVKSRHYFIFRMTIRSSCQEEIMSAVNIQEEVVVAAPAAKKVVAPKREPHLRSIGTIAWRVAAQKCGYMMKNAKGGVDENGVKKTALIPYKGTPEHAKIQEIQQALIKEWETANAIPDEYLPKKKLNEDGTEKVKKVSKKRKSAASKKRKSSDTEDEKEEKEVLPCTPVVKDQLPMEFKFVDAKGMEHVFCLEYKSSSKPAPLKKKRSSSKKQKVAAVEEKSDE
jgi:hypothetical protein